MPCKKPTRPNSERSHHKASGGEQSPAWPILSRLLFATCITAAQLTSALAEVCDKIHPDWSTDGRSPPLIIIPYYVLLDNFVGLFFTIFIVLAIFQALRNPHRAAWAVVAAIFSALAAAASSFVGYQTSKDSDFFLHAIREGCVSFPRSGIEAPLVFGAIAITMAFIAVKAALRPKGDEAG